jgi:ribosomal-protein-alanine N-acetyltransferase
MLKKPKIQLETPRLFLERPHEGQIDMVAPLLADPLVMRYIGKGMTRTRNEVLECIRRNQKHWETCGFGFFNIFEKKSGEFMGRGGLVHLAHQLNNPEIEIGYMFHQKFWGKGYATEFAKTFLDWGFKELGFKSIVGVTWKENIASQNVLKKAGMHFRGEEIYPGIDFLMHFFVAKRLSDLPYPMKRKSFQ